MAKISASDHRRQLREQLDWSKKFATETFANLTSEQLNWKPSPSEWSVGQCFDHMRLGMAPYLSILRQRIDEARRKGSVEGATYKSSFWGWFMIKAVAPESKLPVPVPPPMVPTESPLGPDIVKTFLSHLDQITELLQKSEGIDLSKTRMTSPFAKWLKFPIGDAFMLLVVHNRRHLLQAERVLARDGFPG